MKGEDTCSTAGGAALKGFAAGEVVRFEMAAMHLHKAHSVPLWEARRRVVAACLWLDEISCAKEGTQVR